MGGESGFAVFPPNVLTASHRLCLSLQVAKRCLSFLHNVIQELEILEVACTPDGSVACWVFLSILEVKPSCLLSIAILQFTHIIAHNTPQVVTTCEVKSKEAVIKASNDDSTRSLSNAHVQQYCRYTAELWAYCRYYRLIIIFTHTWLLNHRA